MKNPILILAATVGFVLKVDKSRLVAVVISSFTTIFFFLSSAKGQSLQISPEWTSHFTNTPVISNCVFEYEGFSEQPKTRLLQFRCQDNAFVLRQLRDLNDATSDAVPVMDFYAGRFENNCWAITGTKETSGMLRLFPNSHNIWRREPTNGNEYAVFSAERVLFNFLYYGIGNLDPETVKWSGDSAFTAIDVNGMKLIGQVTDVSQGKPTRLEWRYDKGTNSDFQFVLRYKYDSQFGLHYFPSEIQGFRVVNGKEVLSAIRKTILLDTSGSPLDASAFDPYRYFSSSQTPANRVSVVLYSNNAAYAISSGTPIKVLPSSARATTGKHPLVASHPKLLRLGIVGFILVPCALIYFLWRIANKNKSNK